MPSKTISAVNFRKGLGETLSRISLLGEDIIIEKAGKKIARLVKYEPKKRLQHDARKDFRDSAGILEECEEQVQQ